MLWSEYVYVSKKYTIIISTCNVDNVQYSSLQSDVFITVLFSNGLLRNTLA